MTTVEAGAAAWLLARPGALPEDLRARARTMELVALTGDELARLCTLPAPSRTVDERLLDLVSAGAPKRTIERELGLSSRTVDRRLQALRTRYAARSNAELTAILARREVQP